MTTKRTEKPTLHELKRATEQAWMILDTREKSKVLTDELRGALKRALKAAKDREERELIRIAMNNACATFEAIESREELTAAAEWILETFNPE